VQNDAGTPQEKWHVSDTSGFGNVPPASNRSAMSKWAKPAHKAAARAFGYALTLDDEAGWSGLSVVMLARLSDRERVALAWAVLTSLPPELVRLVTEAVEQDSAPPDPLNSPAFREAVAEYRQQRGRGMQA
jgi:hypothetical protein